MDGIESGYVALDNAQYANAQTGTFNNVVANNSIAMPNIAPKPALLYADSTGTFQPLPLTTGQIPVGVTGQAPVAASIIAGTNGIDITQDGKHDTVIDIDSKANITINSLNAPGGIVGPITPTGNLLPSADATYNLGSALFRWANAFISGAVNAASGVFGSLHVTGTSALDSTVTCGASGIALDIPQGVLTFERTSNQMVFANTSGIDASVVMNVIIPQNATVNIAPPAESDVHVAWQDSDNKFSVSQTFSGITNNGVYSSTNTLSCGTATVGALTSGAITASGIISSGTNSIACGSVQAGTYAINGGQVNCGNIVSTGVVQLTDFSQYTAGNLLSLDVGNNIVSTINATGPSFTTVTVTSAHTNALSVTGGVSCGPITASGTFSCGTNSATVGALSSGAITASGTFSCGTNSATVGSLSSGAINTGTNSITCGPITASGTFSCGTNSATVGALTSGAINAGTNSVTCGPITSSGTFTCGTNGAVCGALNSGSINAGTNSVTCGPITSSGTFTCGTNAMTCGALSSGAITASGTFSCGTNSATVGALTSGAITASGTISCGTNSMTAGAISATSINFGNSTLSLYNTRTANGTVSGPWTSAQTCNLHIVVIGSTVTMSWAQVSAATSSSAVATHSVTLNANERPTSASLILPIWVIVNNAAVAGSVTITTAGAIIFEQTTSSAFPISGTGCGFFASAVTWNTN